LIVIAPVVIAFVALIGSPIIAQRGSTGAADCRVCKNCSSCRHCSKEHGTCGVCTPCKNPVPVPSNGNVWAHASSQNNSELLSEHWRWAIKTGADTDVSSVALAPKIISVDDLVKIARPEVLTRHRKKGEETDHRIDPVETTKYQVQATIIGYKLEPDGDYHIVVQGSTPDKTMIVEIPDPADVSSSSKWKSSIQSVRKLFEERFPDAGKRIKHTSVKAVITGIGFWDKKHGQTGLAPSGIELHPVLNIKFIK
jgi:hypothetical protein